MAKKKDLWQIIKRKIGSKVNGQDSNPLLMQQYLSLFQHENLSHTLLYHLLLHSYLEPNLQYQHH